MDATGNSFLLFATVLFTVAVFFYIFKPARAEHAVEKTRLAFLYERKEQTFENLRDLNFEYKAGKLSDADFSSMRDSMEQEAANLLAEIEELEHESGSRQRGNRLMRRTHLGFHSDASCLLWPPPPWPTPSRGTVTNGTTGKPAAGVAVTLVDPMGGMAEVATAKC